MKSGYVFLVAVLLLLSSFSIAAQNQGPENMEVDGGKRGVVPLPHRSHQTRLNDCNICHSVFPQKSGSIKTLKAEGKLKKKFVMNKLCIKCHRAEKRAGRPSGPVKCSKCHIK